MKVILFRAVIASFLLFLVFSSMISGCVYGRGVERREILRKVFDGTRVRVLDIANVNGMTRITPSGESDSIEIEAHIYVSILERYADSASAEIKKIQVITGPSEKDRSILEVRVRYPEKREHYVVGAWVDFYVKVPERIFVRSVNNNGSFETGCIKNNISARLVNGSFKSDGIKGSVEVESINGSIEIRESEGAMKLNTQNGNINIFLNDGVLEARTLNGSVNAVIRRLSATSKIQTTNGFVSVKCFETPNFRVECSSEIGAINIDRNIKQGTEPVLMIRTKVGGIIVNP